MLKPPRVKLMRMQEAGNLKFYRRIILARQHKEVNRRDNIEA